MNRKRQSVILPFTLTLLVILLDQLSKWWIVDHVRTGSIHASFLSDFLWIVHVRNNAVGFSLGSGLPDVARTILFIVLPLILLFSLIIYIVRSRHMSLFQRWTLSGIIGGGLGNLGDRMFREEWVVDFISVRVYGFLGFERWPTFNVADASIVVCAILLMISLLFEMRGERKGNGDSHEQES